MVSVTVTGLVQGVGYRPFVAELASALGLVGEVKNTGGIVTILADGDEEALEQFVRRLRSSAPKGAVVKNVQVERVFSKEKAFAAFSIAESAAAEEEVRLLSPDLPVCESCVRELSDETNRRYRHPFISCVSCGPRFSILKAVPYDRENITMDVFSMCPECEREYRAPGERRRHAQTIACHSCGPYLRAAAAGSASVAEREEALALAVSVLKGGGIVAVKDIGGFHFAFLPNRESAAARLREWKNREKKPFAVMFERVDQIREYAFVSGEEEALLRSNPRPIVLLSRKKEFAPGVCAGSSRLGAMLFCSPLQLLLLRELGPLVMTSGNRGGEPIVTADADMRELLSAGGPDLILTHGREILTPLEDSVCQVSAAGASIIRRGRGYVPEPVRLPRALPEACFAAGGDLKAVFALGKGRLAYLSAPFGDLEDYRASEARRASAAHMAELLNIHPKRAAADLHPGYHSAREELFGGLPLVRVQHHHAHILSVMAEHGLEGAVLGAAFDGTGYGTDGGIWGSEFLLCEGKRMERVGHLAPVVMAGAAEKDAAVSLWCYLLTARERGLLTEEELAEAKRSCFAGRENLCGTVAAARRQGIQSHVSTSMGRLFDAVSALLGICDFNSYEGECAILLESAACGQRAAEDDCRKQLGRGALSVRCEVIRQDGVWLLDGAALVARLFRARAQNIPPEVLALEFHREIVAASLELFVRLREEYQVTTAALSGGCFCNRLLLDGLTEALKAEGFSVYRNEAVPCGDGGLALGQLFYMTYQSEKEQEEKQCV